MSKGKRLIFLITFALIVGLMETMIALAAPKGPVVLCDGLDPVVMMYREKEGIFVGRAVLPAINGEMTFTVRDRENDKVLDTRKIKIHESAAGYKITFTYNPVTGAVTDDYVLAFSGTNGKVAAESLFYNSRDEQYKKPWGAVTAGSEVMFTLETKANDLEKANLVLTRQKITGQQDDIVNLDKQVYAMEKTAVSPDGARDYWAVNIKFDDKNVYTYYFEAIDGNDTVLYTNNTDPIPTPNNRINGVNGIGEALRLADEGVTEKDISYYRLTVYDSSFSVPDWSKDIVYYFIFPDRFKNGDKSNDPKVGVRKFYGNKDIVFHQNWLDKPYTKDSGVKNFEGGNDFFGGDIAGVIQKLDYLKDLGINTIYMTPLFQSPSNHKYDTADFKKIDEAFGTNETYKQLLDEAHKKGIRVIFDASLNHSGADSLYMDRYGKYHSHGAFEKERIRKDSPYYDWYIFDEKFTNPDQAYAQWANPTLAVFNKSSESYKNFAYKGKDSITQFWMKYGIDGWRMDVVPYVPDDFWREWHKTVKSINPDSFTVAEVWWDTSKYYLGDMFDSGMNYVFRQAVFDYVDGKDARKALNLFEMLRENYPAPAFYSTMNLLSSHDAPRAIFHFGYKDDAVPQQEIQIAKNKLLLATFIQMTYPGAPAIYYGDEVGVTGGEDPGCRATYPWKEEGGNFDENLLSRFKELIKLRNDNAVLRRGTVQPVYVDDNIIILARQYEGVTALVATNNSDKNRIVSVNVSTLNLPVVLTDALSQDSVPVSNGMLDLELSAYGGRVVMTK